MCPSLAWPGLAWCLVVLGPALPADRRLRATTEIENILDGKYFILSLEIPNGGDCVR